MQKRRQLHCYGRITRFDLRQDLRDVGHRCMRESLLQGILWVRPSANRLVGVRTRITQDSCPKGVAW
jgi:hypothetical protein